MPSIKPNCRGARRSVNNKYSGRVAVIISEEISVRRLVSPRKNTLLPTPTHIARENNCLRLFLIRSPEFSIGYINYSFRIAGLDFIICWWECGDCIKEAKHEVCSY